ncbi:hemin import ATP-binding protein [Actinobacillus equuli]|nr:hemin import ATP-binding protein [Actinobacillus equuli]
MLKLANVHIKRGSLVIADQLDLSLEKGKVYTVLGPNGAGKSSLLKTILVKSAVKGKFIMRIRH